MIILDPGSFFRLRFEFSITDLRSSSGSHRSHRCHQFNTHRGLQSPSALVGHKTVNLGYCLPRPRISMHRTIESGHRDSNPLGVKRGSPPVWTGVSKIWTEVSLLQTEVSLLQTEITDRGLAVADRGLAVTDRDYGPRSRSYRPRSRCYRRRF